MTMRISPAVLTCLALTLSGAAPLAALDLTPVALPGNVHPAIAKGRFLAPVDRALPMEKMILALKLSPEAEARRDALLKDQLDPRSASYHRWLTPEQFGRQFGPAPADLAKVTGWLASQGFRIDQVTPGGNAILFSGNAGAVMDAFRTTLAQVEVDGVPRIGNLTAPTIPRGLADLVHGVVSLHNVPLKALNTGARPVSTLMIGNPHYTSSTSGSHFLAPGDFATIYNTSPLLAGGVDGSGMTIAIVGRTDILRSDVEGFRQFFGLPANRLAITYNGPNPGITGDETEADLDVEWSGSAAPNATVEFVVSGSTTASDGIILSLIYIINTNLAPVASMSYGGGEVASGAAMSAFTSSAYAQAAAQGQTWFISSGDAGCAGGDVGADNGQFVPPNQINSLGASANNVCVGGTMFDDASGGPYWEAANTAIGASAMGYIPELAWNENGTMPGGSGDWATGGGFSVFVPQPWWQAALVPGATMRAAPDVALAAATHDGYIVAQEGTLEIVGGTSASSPSFAGLMALVVQATGQRQGNANPILYQLAGNQYLGTGPAVFHDITSGNNSVPYTEGYYAGVGFDECTGLGSVDAQAMVANWIVTGANQVKASITSPAGPVAFTSGGTQTFTATATDSNPMEILTYTWNFGDGTIATGSTVTHTFGSTTGTVNYPVVLTVSDSTGNLAAATRNVRVASLDLNVDGGPTLLDLLRLSADMSTGDLTGDLNSDGLVNDLDLAILLGAL